MINNTAYLKTFLLAVTCLCVALPAGATNIPSNKLNGYILIQVEARGEAWYVQPLTGKRFYMKDGDAAYQMMRSLSVGVSEKDYARLVNETSFRSKLRGQIVLRVEAHGEAYYIHPKNLSIHYLQNGTEAYRVMREQSLGITDINLAKIPLSDQVNQAPITAPISNQPSPVNATVTLEQEATSRQRLAEEARAQQQQTDNAQREVLAQQQRDQAAAAQREAESLRQQQEQSRNDEVERNLQIAREQLARVESLLREHNQKAAEIDSKILEVEQQWHTDIARVRSMPISMNSMNGRLQQLSLEADLKIDQLRLEKEALRLDYQARMRAVTN